MMKLWNRTWFSFFLIKTRSSMSVESWSYQKDGKRSMKLFVFWNQNNLRGSPPLRPLFHHFFSFRTFYFTISRFLHYVVWLLKYKRKFWWHPGELWPAEWSTIFSLSARFLMFEWSEIVNPYLFLKRAWMVIVPS